jgi:hypothetical protein
LQIVMTANKSITATFSSPVVDLIIDNPAATFTGTWGTDNAAADKYGIDYRSTGSAAQTPSATATFTPNIQTGGRYDVYVWSPTFSKHSANVPVLVSSSGGNQTFPLNQTTGAGAWRLLATGITFASGTNGFVRIANNVGGGKTVVADAVRLVYSPIQEAVPPTILAQPQSQTTTQGANVAFNVEAMGTEPMGYQWRFNAVNIPNATDATINLTNVQPSDAGNYTVVLTNSVGAVTSSVATLTVLGAPTILSQPQSLAVSIGSNAVFYVLADGAPPLTYRWKKNDIDLTDAGTVSGAASPNLTILGALPSDAAVYTIEVSNNFGSVTSTPALLVVGFESDVASIPDGDNSVDLADWERLGRLVVGLDTLAGEGEFLRADSAPRSSLGDGVMSVIDWVQAGRYAASLDPLTPAGGPVSLSLAQRQRAVSVSPTEAPARALRIAANTLVRERNSDVTVELIALGDENALGLTLSFDPASLTHISASAIPPEATLLINASQAVGGHLGIILGLPPGQTFTAGTNSLLRVTFMPTSASSTTALVSFSDLLVTRELSDRIAKALVVDYLDAILPITAPSPIVFVSSVRLANGQMQLTLSGNQGEVYEMETSTNLNSWTQIATLTNIAGIVTCLDSSATNSAARFYRARLQR